MKGLDYTEQTTPELAKNIVDAGYSFVCRYLVPERYAWKRLTKEEVDNISATGLNIVSVYETSAGYMKGGASQAKQDAAEVKKELVTIGQPPGSAVYFTADFDVTTAYDLDCIERYLRQMTIELPDYGIGIYGEFGVIEVMADRKACEHFWVTYAWSGGKESKHANIYQYHNGATVAGIGCDLNESFGNEGWWSLRDPGPFPDVSNSRWSAASIKVVSEADIMNGYPSGEFKPDNPVTREELAAALASMLGKVK